MTPAEIEAWLLDNLDRIKWQLLSPDGARLGSIKCHFGEVGLLVSSIEEPEYSVQVWANGPGRLWLHDKAYDVIATHGDAWEEREGAASITKAITGDTA